MIRMAKEHKESAKLQGKGFYISKKVGRAITDYHMLDEGDKIAVAVSGGKDSLTLLKILHQRQSFVPIKYSIVAVHIDSGSEKSLARKLKKYFKENDYPYKIIKSPVLRKTKPQDMNCFWCSWNRRKALFETANKLGCSKVALGHHKDDIIETILLNLFFQGEISAMCPKQRLFNGKITLIRPLAYVEEREIMGFAKEQIFPNSEYCCPNANINKRRKISKFIKDLEKICPEIKTNISKSVKRVKKDYLL